MPWAQTDRLCSSIHAASYTMPHYSTSVNIASCHFFIHVFFPPVARPWAKNPNIKSRYQLSQYSSFIFNKDSYSNTSSLYRHLSLTQITLHGCQFKSLWSIFKANALKDVLSKRNKKTIWKCCCGDKTYCYLTLGYAVCFNIESFGKGSRDWATFT